MADDHFVFTLQIENLQEQLRDKEKQMSSLKERVKSLQADTSNTDTALTTLEESLAEKVEFMSAPAELYACSFCILNACPFSLPPARSALLSV